jgi:hypothetical protein
MSFDKKQFRDLITDALKSVDLYSEDAVELLMLTAAQESALGKFLKQQGSGPALGVFQAEPVTIKGYWDWLEHNKPALKAKIITMCGEESLLGMRGNILLQIIMARVHYLTKPGNIPSKSDVPGMAAYWKKWYNTPLGKGTVEEAISNYKKYC